MGMWQRQHVTFNWQKRVPFESTLQQTFTAESAVQGKHCQNMVRFKYKVAVSLVKNFVTHPCFLPENRNDKTTT